MVTKERVEWAKWDWQYASMALCFKIARPDSYPNNKDTYAAAEADARSKYIKLKQAFEKREEV